MKNKIKICIKYLAIIIICFIIAKVFIPKPNLLNSYNFSNVVYDRNGKILNISLTQDDKYRVYIPYNQIPKNLEKALLLYEDKYFYYHFGFNPFSFFRASISMLGGQRIQGGSTITMQLARIYYHIDSRNIKGKIMQILRALQIELHYSKKEILEAYFNIAPYSGNIEGIGAGSLIYFNAKPEEIDITQMIALAVIPQSPSKRNLATLKGQQNVINASKKLINIWNENNTEKTLWLPLQNKKHIPNFAPHFVGSMQNQHNKQINSTIDLRLQQKIENQISKYIAKNYDRNIQNAAVIVVNHKTMEVLAYVGSANFYNDEINGQVDGLRAYRSPGSAHKPFIYALAIEQGLIHPQSMLRDIPKNYGFYTPENYDNKFYGMISATDALIKSRNIPAVELLSQLNNNEFYKLLQKVKVNNLKNPTYYGLTLALGGFEISMLKNMELYAMLANLGEYCPLKFTKDEVDCIGQKLLTPEASFLTLEMLAKNPDINNYHNPYIYNSKPKTVYWKTGTSYGFRDALSLGIAGDYAIGVWVGDFNNKNLTSFLGQEIAAPLFFDIVNVLDEIKPIAPIEKPNNLNIKNIEVCKDTGDIANQNCKDKILTHFIPGVSAIKPSNISRIIPINKKTGLRACSHNPKLTKLEYYNFWPSDIIKSFEEAGVIYNIPPKFEHNCNNIENFMQNSEPPSIVSPVNNSEYFIRSNTNNKITLKASADSNINEIYWYTNGKLVATSKPNEATQIAIEAGKIKIMAIDNLGQSNHVNIVVKYID